VRTPRCGQPTAPATGATPKHSSSQSRRRSTAAPTRSNAMSSANARSACRGNRTRTRACRSERSKRACAARSSAELGGGGHAMGVVARAHDRLVNSDMGDGKQPEWTVRVKEDYFKAGETMFKIWELPELFDAVVRR